MSAKLGLKGVLYYLGSGTRATWGDVNETTGIHEAEASDVPEALTPVTNVKDVTLNLSTGEADATTRAGNGWKLNLQALKDGSVEFDMIWDTADTGFQKFLYSWLNGTPIACAILDQAADIVGAQGLWADFVTTGFSKKEPLEQVQSVTVTIKPTPSAVAPEWVGVIADTP